MLTVILEGRDAPLYHCTDFYGLDKILSTNKILASTRVNGGKVGVCVTRDKSYYVNSLVKTDIQIALDQRKISQRYRIEPYSEESYRKVTGEKPYESEERIVVKQLSGVDKYILHVDMSDKEIAREEKYLRKVRDTLDLTWKGINQILEDADLATDDVVECSGLFLVPELCHRYGIKLGPNLTKIVGKYNIGG